MSTESNKAIVRRFNLEVIQNNNENSFQELIDEAFVNHSASPGTPTGSAGMWNTFHNILHPALTNLTVLIHDQVAEGDLVTTRKTITGRHTGPLFDIESTGKEIAIEVIDIVRVQNGRYVEHWGINTLPAVLAGLRKT